MNRSRPVATESHLEIGSVPTAEIKRLLVAPIIKIAIIPLIIEEVGIIAGTAVIAIPTTGIAVITVRLDGTVETVVTAETVATATTVVVATVAVATIVEAVRPIALVVGT